MRLQHRHALQGRGSSAHACRGGLCPAPALACRHLPASLHALHPRGCSEGTQTFAVWKPWLDSTDRESIFFARWGGALLPTLLLLTC